MPTSEKVRIDLPLLLPDVSQSRDRCVRLLLDALSARDGISQAHVREADGDQQLCIHYDPHILPLERVRQIAKAAGARITDDFGHLHLTSAPLHARSLPRMTALMEQIPGVIEAQVGTGGDIKIEFDRHKTSAEQVTKELQRMRLWPDRKGAASTKEKTHDHGHEGHEHDHSRHEEKSPKQRATGHDDGHDRGKDHDHASHAGHKHGDEGDEHGKAGHTHEHGGPFGEKSELIFSLLSGALVLAGWALERWELAGASVSTSLYVAAYFFGGYYTLREAVENMRAKRFEIDTLMLVAAAGAAALGKWAEGALLLFLFSLGHSLEHYAMGRARRAIEALADLAPKRALVRRGSSIEEVDVGQLQVGDIVVVRPNERMPADGAVVVGETSVNQAPVTGESIPVDKRPLADREQALKAFDKLPAQHRIFAGTINGAGAVDVIVARKSTESTMARVVEMVTQAEAQRSPTQNFTERFERIFVPAVLAFVFLLLFAWVVIDEPFSASFYRAMAVLVAASPCALAISVPSAVLSGVARAGRSGVLVKGGAPLENLGTLTAIAFDKTGTLTEGKPRLTDTVPGPGVALSELLEVALAVERHSDHPIASAIVAGVTERLQGIGNDVQAEALQSITGRGVTARVGGDVVHVGKPVLFEEIEGARMPAEVSAAAQKLASEGRTTMVVRRGERYLGVLGVMDSPRPAAQPVMASLKHLGISRLVMISGDNQKVADAIAQGVGLTDARGDLMPDDKVKVINELRAKFGKVAMVGDGVNDAPAMANATVGIAMGAAGSDVALETADVALMGDDLKQLPFAVGLSRSTSRVIKQNLWVSLGVVAFLIPATLFGLNIGIAVLFHEGSTLLVVANALRLLAYAGDASATSQTLATALTPAGEAMRPR